LIIGILLANACSNTNEIVMLEAEQFAHTGGWVTESAYIDEMGSSYLMAHGMGIPVEDAYTSVKFPYPGTWHLYARTYNWVSPWYAGEAPGVFRIAVGDILSDTIFGRKQGSWAWEYGGAFTVEDGSVEIRISDLSGFNGRVDALVFTTENNPHLPNDPAKLRELREKSGAVPSNTYNEGTYDLVIPGRGIEAIAAALAASRSGLTVALLWDGPLPALSELFTENDNSSEAAPGKPYPALGYLMNEIHAVNKMDDEDEELSPSELFFQYIDSQDGLAFFPDLHVIEIQKEDGRISSLIALNTLSGEKHYFEGLLFADCTANSQLGTLAGLDKFYGEKNKDSIPELVAMGQSIGWSAERVEDSIAFPSCSWAIPFNSSTYLPGSHSGKKWVAGFYPEKGRTEEEIRDYLLRAVYGNWAYLKHNEAEDYGCFVLDRMDQHTEILESSRIAGLYKLTRKDISEQKAFPDAFITISEPVRLYYPDSANSVNFPEEPFISSVSTDSMVEFQLPYRVLCAKGIDNLYMAGSNISVSHYVSGAIRSDRTHCISGEVVGLAAALCLELNCTPEKLLDKYADELYGILKEGVAEPSFQ